MFSEAILTPLQETFGELSSMIHGVVVSSILLPGALSALVAGILADKYGRMRLITIGSVIYGIGAAIECAAPVLGVFITGRLIKGVGEGLFISAIYVQVSEISPTRIRGIMTSLPQFLVTLGLVAGYFICYGTARISNSSAAWRLPLAIGSFLAFAFAATCTLVPPSPRWLLACGRVEEARRVIAALGLDTAEQEQLLADSSAGLEHPVDAGFLASLRDTFKGFGEAFSAPFRARTTFGCFIMGMQQFSGIDGVLYYAPTLFQQAGLSSQQAAFLASGVSALVILGTTIPATLLADHWGRRTSSLLGGTLITFFMLLMGSLYASGDVHADSGAGRWVVIVSIYLFAIVFSATWAIGFRTFLVESMPRKTRSSASSLAQSANWVSPCANLVSSCNPSVGEAKRVLPRLPTTS
jgi:sugar porter (SP) family MFS transporter